MAARTLWEFVVDRPRHPMSVRYVVADSVQEAMDKITRLWWFAKTDKLSLIREAGTVYLE